MQSTYCGLYRPNGKFHIEVIFSEKIQQKVHQFIIALKVQQLTVDLDGTNRVIDIRDMKSYSYSLEELDIQDYYSRTIDKAESIVSTGLPIGRYKNLIKFSRSCLLGAKDEAFQDVHVSITSRFCCTFDIYYFHIFS